MKVLHVIGQLEPGGSEKMTLMLARELRARGEDHSIAVLRHVDPAFVRTAHDGSVPVYLLGAQRDRDVFRAARTLVAIARRANVDVIQGHAWRSSVLAAATGRLAGIAAVATLHRIYYPRIETAADRLIERGWRSIVVDSNAVRDLLVSRVGIDQNRVVVIPNFVDPTVFDVRHSQAGPDGRTRILMAAHFTAVKGHRYLVDAIARLEGEDPGRLVVDLLGDGPLLESTRAMVAERGLGEVVFFHGARSDLTNWLARSDIVVLPSLWEGFGLILAEAAAAGLPTVAFGIGGASEVVVDGVTGLLVEPRDTDALGSALRRLHRSPELRDRLGSAGSIRARRLYSTNPVVEAYQSLYRAVA